MLFTLKKLSCFIFVSVFSLILTFYHPVTSVNASDKQRVIGTLTCTAENSIDRRFKTGKSLSCTFLANDRDQTDYYTGKITKFGLDEAPSAKTVMVWNVWQSGNRNTSRRLQGSYTGYTIDDPSRVGLGKNMLRGGGVEKDIILEPITNDQTHPDLNLALNIVELELQPAEI